MSSIDWKQYGRVLVLIDTANLSKGAEAIGKRVNYRNLAQVFRRGANLTRLVVYIADFGTQAHGAFLDALRLNGFHIVSKPVKVVTPARKRIEHKANFDVEITLDAMDWLESYDTLVLFSGDSDFSGLVERLRSKGKRAIVCAMRHTISRELQATAKLYVDVFRLGEGLLEWRS